MNIIRFNITKQRTRSALPTQEESNSANMQLHYQ